MKKFILKLTAFAIIPLGIYLYFAFFVPVPGNLYFEAYSQKDKLLKETPSPRIVFVGGSSLAFALDSKRISDSIGLPVINTALHAGMGMKFIIDDIETKLRKGDIVVLAPEFHHFDGAAYGESMTLPIVLKSAGWKNLHLLDLKQWGILLKGIPELRKYKKVKFTETTYKASNFNEYGDEVAHLSLPDVEIPAPAPATNPLDNEFCEYFAGKLNRIKEKCTVIITPCAHRESLYNAYKPNIDKIEKKLAELGHPFNVPPRKHALHDSCAYDTDYHMNKYGVEIYTGMIIEELKETLNK